MIFWLFFIKSNHSSSVFTQTVHVSLKSVARAVKPQDERVLQVKSPHGKMTKLINRAKNWQDKKTKSEHLSQNNTTTNQNTQMMIHENSSSDQNHLIFNDNFARFILKRIHLPKKLFGKNLFPRNYEASIELNESDFTLSLLDFKTQLAPLNFIDNTLKNNLEVALKSLTQNEVAEWSRPFLKDKVSRNSIFYVLLTFKEVH